MYDTGDNNGNSQQLTPAECAARAKALGYEWIALEYDDQTFNPQRWWPRHRDACIAQGLVPGVWVTEGGNIERAPSDAQFAIAEIEGPGDYDGVIRCINSGTLPKVPLATVTNFSTLDASRCRPLIDAGFTCMPEAYLNENPLADPDGLDQMARAFGWPTSQPVAGVYPVNGQVPSYAQWSDWPLADYLGEYVL